MGGESLLYREWREWIRDVFNRTPQGLKMPVRYLAILLNSCNYMPQKYVSCRQEPSLVGSYLVD